MITDSDEPLILVIDDERHVREAAAQALDIEGYKVETFERAEPALALVDRQWRGIVISDIRMPGMEGMQVLERLHQIDEELPVVLITGHGDVSMAVQAIKAGAYDFIEKPYARDVLLEIVARACDKRRLTLENRALRRELSSHEGIGPRLVGNTPVMQRLRKRLLVIAETGADVLLRGETGSGKEVAARFIHQNSQRRDGPFVAVNCGALPKDLIESELFGHEAGAFTGALKKRVGKFEHSHGGTLFLDEIESMPMDMQVKILRVLQERLVERLGSNQALPLDLRIIAATKADLLERSSGGLFREDLYYRLNVATADLPPLRERREDIPLLFEHFLLAAAARLKVEVPATEPQRRQWLMSQDWPGNVRELRNSAERFLLFGDEPDQPLDDDASLPAQVARFEKGIIKQALDAVNGNISEASSRLGIPRKTLTDKLQRHGLH